MIVCPFQRQPSAVAAASQSLEFYGRAMTCTSNAAACGFDSHTAQKTHKHKSSQPQIHVDLWTQYQKKNVEYLQREAASGVVFTLSDAVDQHFNLPINPSLLRPIKNTLLQERKKTPQDHTVGFAFLTC